jgi:hypothetical protein
LASAVRSSAWAAVERKVVNSSRGTSLMGVLRIRPSC